MNTLEKSNITGSKSLNSSLENTDLLKTLIVLLWFWIQILLQILTGILPTDMPTLDLKLVFSHLLGMTITFLKTMTMKNNQKRKIGIKYFMKHAECLPMKLGIISIWNTVFLIDAIWMDIVEKKKILKSHLFYALSALESSNIILDFQ